MRGVHHSQVWMGGTPTSRSGQGGYLGYHPWPGLDGVSPSQDWMGLPPPQPGLDGVTPPPLCWETEQHSEHLLRGGRYASCVHAGRLSCLKSVWYEFCAGFRNPARMSMHHMIFGTTILHMYQSKKTSRCAETMHLCVSLIKAYNVTSGGSKGGRQGRAPPRSKFFHFHAVFGKNLIK